MNAEGRRVSQYISDIEQLINTSILGIVGDPCHWMCPYDANKKELCPITMDNVRTCRVIDSLDTMIDICVTGVQKHCGQPHSTTTALQWCSYRKRDNFTNETIATYQNHADKFYQAWIRLWQKEGVTNYLHMRKNLYRFSHQQGWEAMNSLIMTFFFQRTSHGGGVKGVSKKSRLIPIARWLQWRHIFLCRVLEDDICQFALENKMPQNYQAQAISEEDDVYDKLSIKARMLD